MADVALTNRPGVQGTRIITWSPLTHTNTTGQPILLSNHSDKTVQIYGTFDSATVTMQGSNDPLAATDPANAVWFSLVDPQGNAIAKTAAGAELILENPIHIRPIISGGVAVESITVIINAKVG